MKKKQSQLSFTPLSGFGSKGENVSSVTTFKYDYAKVRELAAHMTLYHEYPFNKMEHVLFSKFMRANTPHWQKISRATCKNDCISTYEIEKKKLKTLLKSVGRVSIAIDLWKSGQKSSIWLLLVISLTITGNYKKRVLNFCNIPPPHTGVIITDALYKSFVGWGLEDKVSTITVDNVSYNDSCLKILKDNFALRNKLFCSGKIFHVRCCAHIINLLVQDGLSQIGDIVECVRDGVKYIGASEARLILFSEIRDTLQLPCKKLILDCPTRWNGTYMMLAVGLEFKDVFPRFQERDARFKYVPTLVDWMKVEQVSQFLGLFNEVTNIISGSEYPTANFFLPEIFRIKEVLNEKSIDDCDYIRAMALKMRSKFDKYWGECNLLMSLGAVLDPRYKMSLVEFCFPAIYTVDEAKRNILMLCESLYEVFSKYVSTHTSTHSEQIGQEFDRSNDVTRSVGQQGIGRNIVTGRSKFDSFIRRTNTIQPLKFDLDVYLEEGVYICDEDSGSHFDALEWWKANYLKFRTLSKMACDILSIPITTVASESTFSAGGKVIDPYHASLSTETVQVLMCGSDWVRALHRIKNESNTEKNAYSEISLP